MILSYVATFIIWFFIGYYVTDIAIKLIKGLRK